VVAAVGLLSWPAVASAAVRAVSVADPLDQQAAAFEPRYRTDLEQAAVAYDEAGAVTFTATFFQPEPDGSLGAEVTLGSCGDDDRATPLVTVTMSASARAIFGASGVLRFNRVRGRADVHAYAD
jgi:hypothetical protein